MRYLLLIATVFVTAPAVGQPAAAQADRGLAALQKYKPRIVRNPEGKVVTFDLTQRGVADADLVHLRPLQHLQHLYLADNQLTNAGLAHLKGLKTLLRLAGPPLCCLPPTCSSTFAKRCSRPRNPATSTLRGKEISLKHR